LILRHSGRRESPRIVRDSGSTGAYPAGG
jgi:hypothetical protein